MKTIFLIVAGLLLISCQPSRSVRGEHKRTVYSLNGTWQFLASNEIGDESTLGANYESWDTLRVPGNWDTRDRYAKYVGKGFYQRSFTPPKSWKGKQVHLKFGAVYQASKVWVNGQLLGQHIDGYLPFEYNITDVLDWDQANSVVVMADNTYRRGAWWAWGGISREVYLEANEEVRIVYQHVSAIPDFEHGKVDFSLSYKVENKGSKALTTKIHPKIPGAELEPITLRIDGNSVAETQMTFQQQLSSFKLWNVDSPVLYPLISELKIEGQIHDVASDKFGIRKFEVRGEQFFLNDEPVRMNGINRIHDHPRYGNTEPDHLVQADMLDIKSLGCNFARLMHAPLSKNLLNFCDSVGFMIVEEIPVWGDDDPQAFPHNPLTKDWLRMMIERDFNHPCVVAWSVGNELRNPEGEWTEKAMTGDQYGYVNSMLDYVDSLDTTRLKTYVTITAYRQGQIGSEPYEKLDFISMNSYGNAVLEAQQTHDKFPGKPIFISEIGKRQIGPAPSSRLSEDLVEYLRKLKEFPWITGVSLWSYNDYRSNYRGTPESGFREWGIVDEHRNKKVAYQQLKKVYQEW